MVEKKHIHRLVMWVVLSFSSLEILAISNEEGLNQVISYSEVMEHGPPMSNSPRISVSLIQAVDISNSYLTKNLGKKFIEEHLDILGIDKVPCIPSIWLVLYEFNSNGKIIELNVAIDRYKGEVDGDFSRMIRRVQEILVEEVNARKIAVQNDLTDIYCCELDFDYSSKRVVWRVWGWGCRDKAQYESCSISEMYVRKGFFIDAESGVVLETIYNSVGVRNNAQTDDGEDEYSNFIPIDEIGQMGEASETKSSYVIMTGLYFPEEIYINENQIIEVWSQNISSETRTLYHKIFGRYPDGSSFYGESDHIQIQPGKWLLTYFTVYNTGKGVGFFDFSCEVWEDIDSWPDVKHDEKSDRYWATFYKPTGVSDNYYCDDMWHHPSDSRILENALYVAGGKTSPRDAGIALMDFVHHYVNYDPDSGQRTADILILSQRRGDCNDFADLYIGLARAINIPTRVVCGDWFNYNGGEEDDLGGAYCTSIRNEGHAWAESYYNGAFHHVDPTWNVIEYPRVYVNSSSDVHSIHASAYTLCSDNYLDNSVWVHDRQCCINGFYDVTTVTDGGYDTKYYCPSDVDNDGICDNFDPDKDGDGIPNQSDPEPCSGTGIGLADIPSLFPAGNFHVVGDTAYCTDVLGTANLSWIFGFSSIQRPEGRTDRILPYTEHDTGNLLITGGPAVNPLAVEFGQYFGITYRFENDNFIISCENQEIALPLSQYPQKDIAIIYLGREGERTILLTWGYGWQGTYAATVLMSHPDVWGVYGEEHLLFAEWVDFNYDGLITWNEIRIAYPYHVSLSPPPSGSWWLDIPVFRNVPWLFGSNSFHVVGDTAYCTDVLGTANVSWLFGSNYGYMQRPEGRTDTILPYTEHQTGNLLITGGPAVNPLVVEFGQLNYFNISYVFQQGDYFEISSDGCRLRLELEQYPQKDICIIHLGRQNNRNVLLIWGYGWQGTYAGTLFMATYWNIYPEYHMLLIEWTDANFDGLVQLSEIAVKCAGYGPHIV